MYKKQLRIHMYEYDGEGGGVKGTVAWDGFLA
jgi:hypothetical protein